MKGDNHRERLEAADRAHVWHPLTQHQAFARGRAPLVIVGGEGVWVFDIDGRRYLDAAAGLWCVNAGYGRWELVAAATEQMGRLPYYPLTQTHPAAIALAAKLAGYLPHTPHIFFTNSGSEANETAFKAVRHYWRLKGHPRKVKILSRHRGYHGATLGALSATGQPERRRDYEPLAPGFIQVAAPYCYRCPFHLTHPACGLQCALDFERRIEIEGADTVAAIIVEPVVAGGGVIVPPQAYLPAVAEIARRHDVKLIVDEVVTGFGRLGDMFAHPAAGVVPDVVTMAKGLASGYMPIGAAAFSEEIFSAFLGEVDEGRHLRHVHTFSGHPVAAAVALRNIELLEAEGLPARARRVGARLRAHLEAALAHHPLVGEVRGAGLLLGVELVEDRGSRRPQPDAFLRRLAHALLDRGVIVGKASDVAVGGNNILMLAPPLVLSDDEADVLVARLTSTLAEIRPMAPA
jgi:taurine-pyruvate aminotransferase